MCGINGIFSYQSRPEYAEKVKQMNAAIQHRGPDFNDTAHFDHMHLGHCRLSIIDLNEASNQPFRSHDGRYVMVFNGEIYNYATIKAQLSDYPFRTSSDTEVLLAAYQKWGADCLSKLNGMFAFIIYDLEQRSIFIARDRLGIKPLYYYRSSDYWVFSSEIKGMLASGLVPRKLSVSAVSDYLRYQTVHAPETMVAGVKLLMPGHYRMISEDEEQEEVFWDISTTHGGQPSTPNYEAAKQNVKSLFFDAVQRRMIADVPYGAFLSGGIDSSAIVGTMSQISNKPIQTFSVVFDESEFSEAQYSRMVAERFATDHHEIRLKPETFLEELPNALNAIDHPSGDGPNSYVVSKVTKEAGITVALSGLGGDELFAGYPVFRQLVELNEKKWMLSYPKMLRRLVGSVYQGIKKSTAADKMKELLIQDYFEIDYAYPISRQLYLDHKARRFLSSGKLSTNRVRQLVHRQVAYGSPGFSLPYLGKVSICEMSTYMQNVLLRDTDVMSMAHALEVRVPFLDHELVEYVLRLPDEYKLQSGPKQLLTDSLGDLLPTEIINRPKMGFVLPWDHWLRKEMRDLAESHLKRLAARDWINGKVLMQQWEAFLRNDKRVNWTRLWILIVLENWLEKHQLEA